VSCPERQELITRYVTGDLPAAQREEMERHVTTCPSCREELTVAENLERILEGLPLSAFPAGLDERIRVALDHLEREELESRLREIIRARRFPLSKGYYRTPLVVAASVALVSPLLTGWISLIADLPPWIIDDHHLAVRSLGAVTSWEDTLTDPVFLTVITTLLYSLWMAMGRPFLVVGRLRNMLQQL